MMGNYHVRFGKGFLANNFKIRADLLFHNDNSRTNWYQNI
jgi:hypothetical protein